eukprot:TRINITY_DN15174_c0_g1_i2.p1 TRINITY_DN15174_c0_g1~~TRINITY_DN15174_c0_g1_i2.p1  ORF type:complete len:651 (+),score=183.83 TRINITY_DN15174_c0_g1_i2:58-1953(+)
MNYLTKVAGGLFSVFKEEEEGDVKDSDALGDIDEKGSPVREEREAKWKGEVGLYKKVSGGVYSQIVDRALMELLWVGGKDYNIEISSLTGDKTILRTPIGDGLSITYHTGTHSVMFTCIVEDTEDIMEWSVVMMHSENDERKAMLQKFLEAYNECSYSVYYNPCSDEEGGEDDKKEEVDEEEPEPVPPEERSATWCGVSASPCRTEGEGEPSMEMYECDDYEEKEEEEEEGSVEREASQSPQRVRRTNNDRNLMFADVTKSSRMVVLKDRPEYGTVLGVHAYTSEGFDENNTVDITSLKWDSNPIAAQELISVPHDDTKALLLDPSAPQGGVYLADISHEKIISTYAPGADLDLPISHILPTAMDTDPHLVTCLVQNAVFGMDIRRDPKDCGILKEDGVTKTVMDWSLSLPGKKALTCHATTPDGKLAVGNYNGEIRLYSGTPGTAKANGKGVHPKTTKTLLPGSGHPIKYLDITKKGDWLIATMDKFLVLLKVSFVDDSDEERNGFMHPMGKKKPMPIKLELGLKVMKEIGMEKTFNNAKFEKVGEGKDEETRIVASIGNILVSWNLDLIKKDKERGVDLVGIKHDSKRLVDVSASKGTSIKYITEDSVSMAMPKTRSHLTGGKFTLSFR